MKVNYGWLTKGERIERFMDEKPGVKDHTTFKYVGQSRLHSDARLKVSGEAIYTADVKIPGRVYAKILRPPSHLAKLKSVDYSEAERIEGEVVVHPLVGGNINQPGQPGVVNNHCGIAAQAADVGDVTGNIAALVKGVFDIGAQSGFQPRR